MTHKSKFTPATSP